MKKVVSVVNFEKYNPRKDRAHHHWFRMEDNLFINPQLADFSSDELLVWVFILATTCQRQGKEWLLVDGHVSRIARVSIDSVMSAVTKLSDLGLLLVTDWLPTGITTEHNSTLQNITTTTEQKTKPEDVVVENGISKKAVLAWEKKYSREWLDLALPTVLVEIDSPPDESKFSYATRDLPRIVRINRALDARYQRELKKQKPRVVYMLTEEEKRGLGMIDE